MSERAATGLGFVAILLWALLASLTAAAATVPPFQLVAMSFTLAALIGVLYLAASRQGLGVMTRLPAGAWASGVAGLFGYHALYFLALRHAPTVEANLLNYLWPLLIVLLAALVPAGGARLALRWWHVAGALLGLAGTVVILTQSGTAEFDRGAWLGYGAALAAALVWASYSVVARRYAAVPSAAVAGYCLVTAVAALLAHLAVEETVWPADARAWGAVAGLGLGPVGLAFYAWDHGVKHGDIRVLGAAAYATPLLSTLLLVVLGIGKATTGLWIACALITGGALLAARDLLWPRER